MEISVNPHVGFYTWTEVTTDAAVAAATVMDQYINPKRGCVLLYVRQGSRSFYLMRPNPDFENKDKFFLYESASFNEFTVLDSWSGNSIPELLAKI